MSFSQNLAALPEAAGTRLRLYDGDREVAVIANAPGTAGSYRLYAYLAQRFGAITPAAAQAGIELFAEYGALARAQPGAHPNIDRLFDCIAAQRTLHVSIERD